MKYATLSKYVALGLIPTSFIVGAEAVTEHIKFEYFSDPFFYFALFCMTAGFAIGLWVIHRLGTISHPGWFRLNAVLTFFAGAVGFAYGADFSDFGIDNFVESIIFTVVFSAIYVMFVLAVRWVYLGFANAKAAN